MLTPHSLSRCRSSRTSSSPIDRPPSSSLLFDSPLEGVNNQISHIFASIARHIARPYATSTHACHFHLLMLGSGSPPSLVVTSSNVRYEVGLMLHRCYHFFLSPPLKYSSLDGGKSPPIFDVVEHDPCYVDRLRLDSWWTYTSCLATSIFTKPMMMPRVRVSVQNQKPFA